MGREIVVNVEQYETRIAILEDGQLVELLMERSDRRRLVGDIYKGTVSAVLPGMQAAFVDIGMEKSAFLHVSDMVEDESDENSSQGSNSSKSKRDSKGPNIQDLVSKNQDILVQVTKEPIGTKGPRVSSQISLPGRYLVLMPGSIHVGISRKIDHDDERDRLRSIAEEFQRNGMGLIVRTVAEGAGARQLKSDAKYLLKLWDRISKKARRVKAPHLVHSEMDIVSVLVRDVFTSQVDSLVIDSKRDYKMVQSYLKSVAPKLKSDVVLYTDKKPVFDAYGVESEIEKTLHRKVWLKKGGYITIDHAEAMVVIDVNTGRYTGKKDQEETIYRTNLMAAREVARQLRLRDIGGIIVIDFIDMEDESNKERVVAELRKNLAKDRARHRVYPVGDLGIVQMTRERVRPSLLYQFSDPCPRCEGTGKVLSADSITLSIERSLRRLAYRISRRQAVVVRANPDIAEYISTHYPDRLRKLGRSLKLTVSMDADSSLRREEFRVVARRSGEDLTELSRL
jgi:ribonuclease G